MCRVDFDLRTPVSTVYHICSDILGPAVLCWRWALVLGNTMHVWVVHAHGWDDGLGLPRWWAFASPGTRVRVGVDLFSA